MATIVLTDSEWAKWEEESGGAALRRAIKMRAREMANAEGTAVEISAPLTEGGFIVDVVEPTE